MAYLYRHIRLDKNEPFYVGIGSDDSYNRAKNKVSRSNYWKNIVSKTDYRVDIVLDGLSWEEACEKEIEFVKIYGRANLSKGSLCNLTDGGEGSKGAVRSTEWRKNKSEEMKGKFVGEKNPFYGKKHSDKSIQQMSENQKGKSLTDETKRSSLDL